MDSARCPVIYSAYTRHIPLFIIGQVSCHIISQLVAVQNCQRMLSLSTHSTFSESYPLGGGVGYIHLEILVHMVSIQILLDQYGSYPLLYTGDPDAKHTVPANPF